MVDRTNNALPNTTYNTSRYKDILRHTCARNEAVGCQGEQRCVMQQNRKFACCVIFGHPYLLVAVHPSTQTRFMVLLNEARSSMGPEPNIRSPSEILLYKDA